MRNRPSSLRHEESRSKLCSSLSHKGRKDRSCKRSHCRESKSSSTYLIVSTCAHEVYLASTEFPHSTYGLATHDGETVGAEDVVLAVIVDLNF